MFDLGWSEMMLIGIVALIVVGPKELPGLFRSIGQVVGKARGMAREFSRAMESAADETGLREIDRTIRAAARPVQFGADRLRDAAGLPKPGAKGLGGIMTAGTPIAGGKPVTAPPSPAGPVPAKSLSDKPVTTGPSTAALAQRRADEQAALRLSHPVTEAPPAAPAPETLP